MRHLSLVVLLPLSAFAGSRGALRALRALEQLQDTVADSDADCSKRLGKKLEALAEEVDDRRKLRAQVKEVVSNQRLTAQQLGPVLDAFPNELIRLDVARAAAPRLVDPQHALGHAGKWRNSLLAADFSKLLTR